MACVLAIEDSVFIRRLIVRIMKNGGHEVLEAGDGQEGVEMAEKHKPDCILLDISMPGMSGFDVLDTLNKKGIKIPVVILSADIQQTSRDKCTSFGVVEFIRKPPKERELLEGVKKALDLTMEVRS